MFYSVSLSLRDLDVPMKIFRNLREDVDSSLNTSFHPGAAIISLTVIKNVIAASEESAAQKIQKIIRNEIGMSEFLLISSQRGFQPHFDAAKTRKISLRIFLRDLLSPRSNLHLWSNNTDYILRPMEAPESYRQSRANAEARRIQ